MGAVAQLHFEIPKAVYRMDRPMMLLAVGRILEGTIENNKVEGLTSPGSTPGPLIT